MSPAVYIQATQLVFHAAEYGTYFFKKNLALAINFDPEITTLSDRFYKNHLYNILLGNFNYIRCKLFSLQ